MSTLELYNIDAIFARIKKKNNVKKRDSLFKKFIGRELNLYNFNNLDLRGIYMHDSSFKFSNFSHSNISQADLSNSDLECALLKHTNCISTNFKKSNLSCADLTGANFAHAHLEGCDMSNTIYLNTIFTNAYYDKDTILPFDIGTARKKGMVYHE